MHHPARSAVLGGLLSAVSQLAPRVVVDPCPDDFASPLRTAKAAWAAIAEDATHHLVLQDDVRVANGFATQLLDLLGARGDQGLALFTSWHSPHNSYLCRLAAVLGAPLAPLSVREWTPTLGFVLPAARACELATFLAEFPDEVRDEDMLVTTFCRQVGLPRFATIPSLLDHTQVPTLAGHPGRYYAVAFRPGRQVPAGYWESTEWEGLLAARAQLSGPCAFTVELVGSRCLLRILNHVPGEPMEHPFGWNWHDWCGLVGAAADRIVDGFERHQARVGALPLPAIEVWAAAYLLGADAANLARDTSESPRPVRTRTRFLRSVVDSWIQAGVRQVDIDRQGGVEMDTLTRVGVAAVAAGLRDPLDQDEVLRRLSRTNSSDNHAIPPE